MYREDSLQEPFPPSPTRESKAISDYLPSNAPSSRFSWARIRYFVLPVELVAFLYAFQVYFHFQFYQQYFYQIPARQILNLSSNFSHCLNQTDIVDMSDNKTFSIIQNESKHLFLITAICSQLPSIPVLILLGGIADKYGRKKILYIVFAAQILETIVGLVVVYLELNMYFLLIGGVISGLSGSFGAALIAATTYVVDITPKRWLTIRIGLVQVCAFVGTTAGGAANNSWLGANGCDFHPPMWLLIVVSVVAIFYAVILPESLTEERKKELQMKPKRGLQAWITGVKIYFWPPFLGLSRYWKVLAATTALAFATINTIGFVQISTYYFENKPLEWSLELISLYNIVVSVAHCVALVVVLPLLVVIGCPDVLITLIGVVMVTGVIIFFGFVQHSWPVWLILIAGAVQSAQTIVAPTLRSVMSKLVEPDHQGALFSFLFSVEMMCSILATLIYINLYQSTGMINGKKVSQSMVFWVMAGVWAAVVPFLVLLMLNRLLSFIRPPCTGSSEEEERRHLITGKAKKAIQ